MSILALVEIQINAANRAIVKEQLARPREYVSSRKAVQT
jgi:hypothetical protein